MVYFKCTGLKSKKVHTCIILASVLFIMKSFAYANLKMF